MKLKIFVIILLILGIIFYISYSKKEIELSPAQVAKKLNTENVFYFPENTILFLNNIQLFDNYNNFKKTNFYKKLIDLKIIKVFSERKSVSLSKNNLYAFVDTELTFENFINLIGNNITFGISNYEKKFKPEMLLVLNIFNQGLFFEKLFELLEREGISRNTKYSYKSKTVKIVELKNPNQYIDKFYFIINNDKFIFSTSQKWIEDIIEDVIRKNSIGTNLEFNKLIKKISIKFSSGLYLDFKNILKLIEFYIDKKKINFSPEKLSTIKQTINKYGIINEFIIVSDIFKTESLISYNKFAKDFNITKYLGKPVKINLTKYIPVDSLFTYSLASFNLKEYIKLFYEQSVSYKQSKKDFNKFIKSLNKKVEMDLEKEFFNLIDNEFNFTFYKVNSSGHVPSPSLFIMLKTKKPKKVYVNLLRLYEKISFIYNLNFEVKKDNYKDVSYDYIDINFPLMPDLNPAVLNLDEYIILCSGSETVKNLIKIYKKEVASFQKNELYNEYKIAEKKLNFLFAFNGEESLNVIQELSKIFLKAKFAKSKKTSFINNYENIDPVFDLLKTVKGLILFSRLEDDNFIRSFSHLKVKDIVQ